MGKLIHRAVLCVALLSTAGALSAQLKATEKPIIKTFTFDDGASITNLSDNGLWGTAKAHNSENETYDDHPYLLNATTGGKIYLLTSEETAKGVMCGAYDVTNDGKVIVGNYNHYPAVYKNEKWTTISQNFGSCEEITPDGKYIIGNYRNGYDESPLIWELDANGNYQSIPISSLNLPTINAAGEKAEQSRFVKISADGNIILGCLDFSYPGYGGCCYYVYNRQNNEYNMIGLDKLQIPDFVDMAAISNNGKWVTGTVYYGKNDTEYNYPFKYNVETKDFTILEESDSEDTGGFAISGTGIPFAATPYNNPGRILKYKSGNFWYTLQLVLFEKYGINYFTETGFDYTGTPIAISDDGKTLASIAMSQAYSYIITLPETFDEAAASVNLLAAYNVTPATGATLSHIKTFDVLFDKEAKIESSKTTSIKVTDSKGATVQNAYSIQQNASNAKKYTIYFRTKTLTDGEKYTLTIPEGTFYLEGTDMKSPEIKVSYIGRDNVPVKPLMINPDNNASVSELSYTSPINIQFDVPLNLVSGIFGYLYQEDEAEPLCEMALTISSNYLAVYPDIKRYLYKDINYKVVIPQGAVTDILGECANEEIVLNYTGIYERPLPDGNTLYFEDFNDPNTSYNNVLIFDGDNNTPNAEMSGYGFKENSGWHLLIKESDESGDYCAASTSMYTPAGKSNDWMSTPQLYLPNKHYTLSFKSQSFKKNKDDRLKVYVWENDEVISVLNSELIKRFKEEGTLIYDEQELPGDDEHNLTNEWKSTKLLLTNYSGKNVYIGFLNDNEDQSMVFVDDITVVYEGPFSLGSTTETVVTGATDIPVSAYIKNTSNNEYSSFKAYFYNEDQSVKDEITVSGLSMKKGDIQKFTFTTPLPLPIGKITNYTIGVQINDEIQEVKSSVKNLAFKPNKRMVIEEGTGSWCGNCPLGILALQHLENLFHDNFIPIGVHQGDSYEFAEYIKFLDFSGYPQGIVNRIDTIYSPMSTKYTFTSSDQNKTFTDIVLREMEKYTDADIDLSNAIYDPDLNQLSVTTTVNYAVDIAPNNCSVFYVILEDELIGMQTNYLYGPEYTDYEDLGEWRAGKEYGTPSVPYFYKDVARTIIGNFGGISGHIPTTVTANTPIKFDVTNTIPSNVTNMNNASIVCMLINSATGRVINAAKAKFAQGVVSIDELSSEDHNINIFAEDNKVVAQFNNNAKATMILYDINGRIINRVTATVNAGESMRIDTKGHTGVTIAKVVANNQTKVQKVILK